MTDFQTEKALVRAHYAALAAATPTTVEGILARNTSDNWHWRGMRPFYEQHGAKAVAETFWAPFLTAFSRVQRREDIFFAGENDPTLPAGRWVVSMGHLMGLFDAPFLGIRPTKRIAMLRYAEFNRVADGKIVETALFIDLLHLMVQAGQYPLPPQTGAQMVQPGPMTHDGLLRDTVDPAEGEATLTLINTMVSDIDTHDQFESREAELNRCWHDDMAWWGPTGIGATYTIERYIKQHQGPFRSQIKDRKFNGHIARLAEGSYGGFFGWANLTVTNGGGYLGMTAGTPSDMRVVDIYRRDGDKLAENWIFIDILHYLSQQGLDVLARLDDL